MRRYLRRAIPSITGCAMFVMSILYVQKYYQEKTWDYKLNKKGGQYYIIDNDTGREKILKNFSLGNLDEKIEDLLSEPKQDVANALKRLSD